MLIPVDCWESQGMPLVLRLLAMACINVSGWLRMSLLHSLRFDGTKWNFEGFHTCGNNFGNNFGARSKLPICTAYYVVLDGRCLVV